MRWNVFHMNRQNIFLSVSILFRFPWVPLLTAVHNTCLLALFWMPQICIDPVVARYVMVFMADCYIYLIGLSRKQHGTYSVKKYAIDMPIDTYSKHFEDYSEKQIPQKKAYSI